MKNLILILSVLVLAAPVMAPSAFAQGEPKTPLQVVMKTMSGQFKIIGLQIKDPSKNASTIEAVKALSTAVHQAVDLMPKSIVKLQSIEGQRAEMLKFQRMILELSIDCISLEEALTAGKQDEANAVLAKIAADRKAGHSAYEEE